MSLVAEWSRIEPILAEVDLLEEMARGFQAYSAGECVVPPVGELLLEEPRGEVHIKYGYVRGGEHYVVHGVRGDKGPFTDVVAGAVPYAALMLLFTSALIFWPAIATWLPEAIGR